MDAGRKRRFVDGHRLVEIEIPRDLLLAELIAEQINALQDICLLDIARAQNAIPAPMLIQGAILRCKGLYGFQVFVQKGVMLNLVQHLHYIMVYRFRNKFGIYASNLLDSPI